MSNPFSITPNRKRSRDDFESDVWTLDELERLKNAELDNKVKEWRYAGLSMDSGLVNPDTLWPRSQQKFTEKMEENLHGKWNSEEIRDLYKEEWDRYWNMFLLLGRAKIIPEVMIIKNPELTEEEPPYYPKKTECLGRSLNFRKRVIKNGSVVNGVGSEPGSPISSYSSDEY